MENVVKSDNTLGVSVNDCRIFLDGSRVQEKKQYCVDCSLEFDYQFDDETHRDHETKVLHGTTYFSLGWGHLEARVQTCFVQVSFNNGSKAFQIERF